MECSGENIYISTLQTLVCFGQLAWTLRNGSSFFSERGSQTSPGKTILNRKAKSSYNRSWRKGGWVPRQPGSGSRAGTQPLQDQKKVQLIIRKGADEAVAMWQKTKLPQLNKTFSQFNQEKQQFIKRGKIYCTCMTHTKEKLQELPFHICKTLHFQDFLHFHSHFTDIFIKYNSKSIRFHWKVITLQHGVLAYF